MLNKSYVTLEQQKCIVCCANFDTGSLLLDMRLRDTFDRHTVTSWGLCPNHQGMYDRGYLALVGFDESKSDIKPNGKITLEGAWRTGVIAHIKRDKAAEIFDMPIPEDLPMIFATQDLIDLLEKSQQNLADDPAVPLDPQLLKLMSNY